MHLKLLKQTYHLLRFKANFKLKIILFISLIWVSDFAFASIEPQYHVNDTITIASESDYPPYCIVNTDGEADGFSVDLFKAATDAVGLNLEIKIGIWNQIKQDLAEGRLDALPFVGRTPEREESFDFTMPYISLHGAVFVRKGTKGIESLADLKDKAIVVMKGDNAEEFVRRKKISDKIFTTNTFEEAFIELAKGKHDAVIMQRVTGIKLLENMGVKSVIPLEMQLPEFRQDFCFAVQKGNEALLNKLNEGLSIVIANHTYREIKLKWFGPDESEEINFWELLLTLLYIIVPLLIILAIFFIYYLRRKVREQTQNLKAEITEHKQTYQELEKQQILLKENEQHIRLLLNSTAEGIYGIDNNGLCTFINKSGLEALAYDTMEKLIGKNMHNLIHHSKADGTKLKVEECKIYQAFREGKGTHSDEEVLWRSDGTNFHSEYFSHPIFHDGKITGAVVTFWDITERKKVERELRKLKNELEIAVAERTEELNEKVIKLDRSQKAMLYMVEDLNKTTTELKEQRRKLEISNKELEAFTYSVSHDLRAPLRAINGFAKFLIEDYHKKLDNEGKRYINTIVDNAIKMDKLITDLLNLSRVTRGSLKYSGVDMKATILSMYSEVATENEKNTFELNIEKLPDISCDSGLIKQVWQNLLSNALKYSTKAKIKKIEITAKEGESEITYFIKDYGAGFNSEYKNKLFGVFQRLHREDEFTGTGVGLAIVQRIISRHGGKVGAEGEINKGATFYFSLPKTEQTN